MARRIGVKVRKSRKSGIKLLNCRFDAGRLPMHLLVLLTKMGRLNFKMTPTKKLVNGEGRVHVDVSIARTRKKASITY